MRALTLKELADAAYPSATNQLPVSKGYYYSNTNDLSLVLSRRRLPENLSAILSMNW